MEEREEEMDKGREVERREVRETVNEGEKIEKYRDAEKRPCPCKEKRDKK